MNPLDAYERRRERELKQASKELWDALADTGIGFIEVQYDGANDDGTINEIDYYDTHWHPISTADLREQVTAFMLAALPTGWTLYEGSYGTAEIGVKDLEVSFDHFVNVTRSNHEPFEIKVEL